jgi:hypothetical protein
MKVISSNIKLQYNSDQKPEIVLTTTAIIRADLEEMQKVVSAGKLLAVEIKQLRNKRSLDANSYFWTLLSKMADALNTSKDELYLQMLERYGVFTHIVVKPNVVEKVKREWRTVKELGEVTVNGKTGIQLQCYFGSSSYDSKEMSVLINGVVQEAKEIGIETATPADIERMKTEWGEKEEQQ